jgi:uncharacterized membrane protein SpoIIM required for sporulation
MAAPALSSRWIARRQVHWTRLETLLARGRAGVTTLAHDELRELALLYRQTAADLSAARENAANAQLAAYLNQLLGRAHNLVYTARPIRRRSLVAFYTRTFPKVFRDTRAYTAAAAALFAAGAVAGWVMSVTDPGFERFVLGGSMMDTIERREMWTHSIVSIKPLASSAIMTNNLSVAFAAFAAGALAGLGTIYMMLFNGVLIGVIGTACYRAGMSAALWSFVAPGALSRRDALAESGAAAIRLLLGVFPLLVVAGLIEGFVSPTAIDPLVKFVIGGSLFALLGLYLFAFNRAGA